MNNPDDMYRSPRSQITVTINPFYNLFASFTAAATAPPLLIPANIAYYFANLFTISMHYSYDTSIISSTF